MTDLSGSAVRPRLAGVVLVEAAVFVAFAALQLLMVWLTSSTESVMTQSPRHRMLLQAAPFLVLAGLLLGAGLLERRWWQAPAAAAAVVVVAWLTGEARLDAPRWIEDYSWSVDTMDHVLRAIAVVGWVVYGVAWGAARRRGWWWLLGVPVGVVLMVAVDWYASRAFHDMATLDDYRATALRVAVVVLLAFALYVAACFLAERLLTRPGATKAPRTTRPDQARPAPPAWAPAPPPPAGPDLAAQLTRLADLHRSGSLTDEEYAAAKARLLD
ncbi:MAG TPA: SHOCT domain-containing protein [Nocardioides sp.]|nr:SHOCT domain-containing protein [Nocardioides sp.]